MGNRERIGFTWLSYEYAGERDIAVSERKQTPGRGYGEDKGVERNNFMDVKIHTTSQSYRYQRVEGKEGKVKDRADDTRILTSTSYKRVASRLVIFLSFHPWACPSRGWRIEDEVKQVHVGGGFKCRVALCLYYLQTKQNHVRAQANMNISTEQSVTVPLQVINVIYVIRYE